MTRANRALVVTAEISSTSFFGVLLHLVDARADRPRRVDGEHDVDVAAAPAARRPAGAVRRVAEQRGQCVVPVRVGVVRLDRDGGLEELEQPAVGVSVVRRPIGLVGVEAVLDRVQEVDLALVTDVRRVRAGALLVLVAEVAGVAHLVSCLVTVGL